MDQSDLTPHESAARDFVDRGVLDPWGQAAERGRRMAAENIRVNPEQRKLVESIYGVPYCKNRYPEAYKNER